MVAIFASLVAASCKSSQASRQAAAPDWSKRHIVAVTHNGGEDQFPSDTLFALQGAHDLGMQVLDVDLQESKDGQPVLTHNDTLDARTNGNGPVSDYTAAELSKLDAAYWFAPSCGNCHDRSASAYVYRGIRNGLKPLPKGARSRSDFGVPTLRQVFERFPDAVIDVELKPQSRTARTVAQLIHEFHRQDRTIVASFDDDQIAEFHRLAPTVAISPGQKAVTAFFLGKPLPPGFAVIQIPYKYELGGQQVTVLTPEFVRRAHEQGLAVWVWDEGGTPGRSLYEELARLRPDGILAARPSDLLAVLQRLRLEWRP